MIENTVKRFNIYDEIMLILHLLTLLMTLLSARSKELSHESLAYIKFCIEKYSAY